MRTYRRRLGLGRRSTGLGESARRARIELIQLGLAFFRGSGEREKVLRRATQSFFKLGVGGGSVGGDVSLFALKESVKESKNSLPLPEPTPERRQE